MSCRITGYSTALYATWFFIEDHGILFDAGDGVVSALGGKIGKIRHIFITHADRDHLTGLLQVLQLNTDPGKPNVYYPKDSGSFPALQHFINTFDPQSNGATWTPIGPTDRIQIKPDLYVEAAENGHIRTDGATIKSLRFFLTATKRKLKPEFTALSGHKIAELRKQHGDDHVSTPTSSTLLAYSGDSPVEPDPTTWRTPEVLIHEATFLDEATLDLTSDAYNLHSHLQGVLESVATLPLQALVLTHFSTRYSYTDIKTAIANECRRLDIRFPVHAVLPMQVTRDILQTKDYNPVTNP